MSSILSTRRRLRGAWPVVAALSCGQALAQQPTGEQTVVVTGNPLGGTQAAPPVSVLAGEALVLERGATLADTLARLPGVTQGSFGPNAARPVLRGLDGDRVRLLANSGATLDLSALSFDHAVPIDPLVATRIEVLRGPAALFYGGSAIGGAVNVLDNRVPERAPQGGLEAAVELRAGGASGERSGALVLDGGRAGVAAWHVDASARRAGDQRVPMHEPRVAGEVLAPTDRVRNSAARHESGAAGGTVFFERGWIGASIDSYQSRYGLVVEPDVTIDLERRQLRLAGAWQPGAGAPVERVSANLHLGDYRHQELEGAAVGTTFRTRGGDLRVEATHAAWAGWQGVLGVQAERVGFSALGEEAFVPGNRTRRDAFFVLEERRWPEGLTRVGVRVERARVTPQEPDAARELPARFARAAERRHAPTSASIGHEQALGAGWVAAASFSHAERAPSAFELYADGVHVATAAYERGDASLGVERARQAELAVQWKGGDGASVKLSAFDTRFARYIGLVTDGTWVGPDGQAAADDAGERFALHRFRATRAQLRGFELEATHRVSVRSGWRLGAQLRVHATRGRDLNAGMPLARLAPLAATFEGEAARGDWLLRLGVDAAARQARVPSGDEPTPGWSTVHATVLRRLALGRQGDALLFVRATNLGNRLAYRAAAPATVRGLTPLAGRAVSIGLRLAY